MPNAPVHGILNIDKPYGMVSMEVVRQVKRASGIKRVGHGGTLDPVATGVVPICLGQATRVMEYVIDGTKDYRGEIELGVTTDTYDSMGQVTDTSDASEITLSDIQRTLKGFQGVIQQVPPMYSALKRGGKRLYELARAGVEVEREARTVEVFRMELLDWSPPTATVELSCGRGFYMRSFAFDLGAALGCGGHLKSLVRLRCGPFHLTESLTLEQALQRFDDGTWVEILHPPDVVLRDQPAIIAGKRLEEAIANGRPLPPGPRLPLSSPSQRCRAYSVDGRFLAILAFDAAAGQWRPEKVFAPSTAPRRGLSDGALPV